MDKPDIKITHFKLAMLQNVAIFGTIHTLAEGPRKEFVELEKFLAAVGKTLADKKRVVIELLDSRTET